MAVEGRSRRFLSPGGGCLFIRAVSGAGIRLWGQVEQARWTARPVAGPQEAPHGI